MKRSPDSRPARRWFTAAMMAALILSPVVLAQGRSSIALAAAPTLPSGFTDSLFASGFASRLTSMEFAPDGRLFVNEKSGAVRVVKNGQLLPTPFVTVVPYNSNERGLLGITFDPNFATNRRMYIFYTMRVGSGPIHNRVSRFTASATNPDVAQAGSEFVLIDDIASQTGAHNGGAIHFGPDGKLYITVGDNATSANSQDMSILAGKILRLNADGSIPADNPFVGQAGKRPEIWASGVRNPYTFDFQPGTGRMFINDVGNNGWEEINEGFIGANYGWPTCEGTCSVAGMTNPIYQYAHNDGSAAITGAAFANASNFPAPYRNSYYFGDYVGNWIKRYDVATRQVSGFATDTMYPVDIRIGPDQAMYYLSVETSEIHRIAYGETPPPPPTPTPTPPLIGDPPVPTIGDPVDGTNYRAGDTITFNGSATDTEDGTLGAASLTWEVLFHHGTHTHPAVEPFSGQTSGSFVIPTSGEASADTWYRIHLRARDSDGNITETTRDVTPRTSTFTLATNPTGLSVNLDGQPQSTPISVLGVVGFIRTLEAPATQTLGGVTYAFDSWSDGGARIHTVTTANGAVTYTARYVPAGVTELLSNTSFEPTGTSWLSPWKWVLKSGASGSVAQDTTTFHSGLRSARATINAVTTESNIQLQQAGVPLVNGTTYTVSFWAKASVARNIAVAIHQTASPYKRYIQKTFALTTAWTRYSFQYASTVDMANAMLVFSLAAATGQVFLDDASFTRPDAGPPPPPPPPPPDPTNLLGNPGFESVASSWLSPWAWKLRTPAVATVSHSTVHHSGTYSAQIDVTTASTDWYVQIIQGKFAITAGTRYTISFWAMASSSRTVRIGVQDNLAPYTNYYSASFSITTTWAQYTTSFVAPVANTNTLLAFNLATNTGQIWLDDVVFAGP